MVTKIVSAAGDGQRLDKYIRRVLPDAPGAFVYKMLRKKNIVLNGKKADGKEAVGAGDEVKFFLSDETFQKFGGRLEASSAMAAGASDGKAVTAESGGTESVSHGTSQRDGRAVTAESGGTETVSHGTSQRDGKAITAESDRAGKSWAGAGDHEIPAGGVTGQRRVSGGRSLSADGISVSAEEYIRAYRDLGGKYPGLRIAYEDENVLIVDKPAGVLSQKAVPSDRSLNEWFVGYLLVSGQVRAEDLSFYTPSVANRLDRNTGGLVLCAKSLPGSRALSELLRDRTVHKYYQMVVAGRVEHAGTLESFLEKDARTNVVHAVGAGASYAKTEYRPLKYSANGKLTLLEAQLVTGRTHQLRVQLADAGHPILGDPKYGNRDLNRAYAGNGVHGQLLYCVRVEFPRLRGALEKLSGKVIRIEPPAVFTRVMLK